MKETDFIDLNVPGLLARYSNPAPDWKQIVLAFSSTQIEFFRQNGLLKRDAAVLSVPINEAVIHFSDYTEEGQRFLRSGAVDKWLAACDKNGTIAAYRDSSGLDRRLKEFRAKNKQRKI